MLPRTQRLSTREFAEVFEKGRVHRHPLLQMRVLRRSSEGENKKSAATVRVLRAAFVAPRKLGNATVRNRMRRRLRECYRLLPSEYFENLSGCDIVVILGTAAQGAKGEGSKTEAVLGGALRELLKRAAKATGKTPV